MKESLRTFRRAFERKVNKIKENAQEGKILFVMLPEDVDKEIEDFISKSGYVYQKFPNDAVPSKSVKFSFIDDPNLKPTIGFIKK